MSPVVDAMDRDPPDLIPSLHVPGVVSCLHLDCEGAPGGFGLELQREAQGDVGPRRSAADDLGIPHEQGDIGALESSVTARRNGGTEQAEMRVEPTEAVGGLVES